jgi:hypothetical protein
MPSITIPGAIIGAGAIAGGTSIASGIIGSNAAQSAAQAQEQAANNATNTQLGIFNQTQANLAPYNQAGQSALSQLASLFGLSTGGGAGTGPTAATAANATSALTQYPGYQFGLQQGNLAQQQSAASQGLLLSGQQLQASQTFGQNYAMQNAWNPYVSQLNTLSNQGENAAAQTGQIGANTGSSVANSQLASGEAAASGIVGSASAITGGINTGIYSGLNSALLGYGIQQQSAAQQGISQLANANNPSDIYGVNSGAGSYFGG